MVQNVNQTAICEFEGQPVFRRRKLTERRTSHFFLENLSKLAPHLLAPILNVQTSHFVKLFIVISLCQSQNGVSGFRTQGAFSELFCRGVVKRRNWTVKLGILCRCICEGRRTPIHRCRKSSRVVQNVNQTAFCDFEGQAVFSHRKLPCCSSASRQKTHKQ